MSDEIKNFLTYDYAKLKDLAKAFLTLVSGVLVFSITFSEKITGSSRAIRWARGMLYFGWLSFGLSIVMSGLALCFNYQAEVVAVHKFNIFVLGPLDIRIDEAFYMFWGIAGWLMLLAGGLFVLGLFLVLASAIRARTATL